MSDLKNEMLSAFADAELSELEARRCVQGPLSEASGRERWGRYHLIRDALQGNLSPALEADLAGRVRAQIEQQPPLGAARKKAAVPAKIARPALGLAVAASVAVVAVIGWRGLTGPTPTPASAPLAHSGPAAQGEARPARATSVATRSPSGEGLGNREATARLNSYLVNHAEYASTGGMLPAARIASYDMTASAERR